MEDKTWVLGEGKLMVSGMFGLWKGEIKNRWDYFHEVNVSLSVIRKSLQWLIVLNAVGHERWFMASGKRLLRAKQPWAQSITSKPEASRLVAQTPRSFRTVPRCLKQLSCESHSAVVTARRPVSRTSPQWAKHCALALQNLFCLVFKVLPSKMCMTSSLS